MAGLKYWVWLSECRGLANREKLLLLEGKTMENGGDTRIE